MHTHNIGNIPDGTISHLLAESENKRATESLSQMNGVKVHGFEEG
jgi:hypothetical protein